MSHFVKFFFVVALAVLFVAAPAMSNTFVVDDNGDPATTYLSLAAAIATAESYGGGPHDIVIMPGSYSDAGLTFSVPGAISSIAGDPDSNKADIVFTDTLSLTNTLLDMSGTSGMFIKHFTVMGYAKGIGGAGLDVSISDMVFDGNSSGIWISNAGGSAIFDNYVINSVSTGIWIGSTSGGAVNGNTISGGGAYALSLVTSSAISASGNCFYAHPGVEGYDNTGTNTWSDNYYGDIAVGASSYALDGGSGAIDNSPTMRSNTPVPVTSTTMEVWSSQVVDFMWATPSVCNPADSFAFAAYEFTVSWDVSKLSYVPNSGVSAEIFSPDGLYLMTDSSSTGKLIFSGVDIGNPNFGSGMLASAEFQAISVGSATISISSLYRDASNNEIPVQSKSLVLALEDTEPPVVVSVTPNKPAGDDTYSEITGFGLEFDACATDNFSLRRILYKIDNGSWLSTANNLSGTSDCVPSAFVVDMTVLSEGPHELEVFAQDWSGNLTDSTVYPFEVDKTGPDIANLVLADSDGCADIGFSSSDVVNVSWDNPDGTANEHEFYYGNAPGWQGPLPLVNPTTYTLDGTEGGHDLWVRQVDDYGNVGPQIGPVSITVDHTDPAPTSPWLVTSPSQSTTVTNQTSIVGDFNMDVVSGTVEFMYSDNMGDIVCDAAGWASAPPSVRPFDITLSNGDGMKVIYFGSRDAAGNVGIVADSIELDQTPPEFTSFSVVDNNGDECSDTWIVKVIVEYDADANEVWLSGTSGSYSASWGLDGTSPDTIDFNINSFGVPACDTFNVVYGTLEDVAGNLGTEMSDNILVDCNIPTITSVLATDPDYDGSMVPHINWSNDANIVLEIVGLAADVNEVQVSETGAFAGEEVSYPVTIPASDPLVVVHPFANPTGCTADLVYVRALDCAGRISAGTVSDGITFDFDAPVIGSFSVTSSDPTNVLSVDLAIGITDNCNAWKMNVYELGYEGDGSGWIPTAASYSGLALANDGDGARTIVLETVDPTGNLTTTNTTVTVDQTPPSGTFVVKQFNNLLALPGFTNSLTDIEIVSITPDSDVVEMAVRNSDGSNNTGWLTLAGSESPFSLVAGGDGIRTVQMLFKDAAGNSGDWTTNQQDIMYLGTAPAPPAAASGTPGGSVSLTWSAVPMAQLYVVKFNRTELYPTYAVSPPPHPADTLEGLPVYRGSETLIDFPGPAADIYSFSIWSIDSAGNLSASPNIDVEETNYILGDINLDGSITLQEDFGAFGLTYMLGTGDPGFNDSADIGPTSDATGTGLPLPDGVIDLEDLIIMGMNYDTYSKRNDDFGLEHGNGKIIPKTNLDIIATVGEINQMNGEFAVSISSANASSIKAYNLVLDYNSEDVELVSIVPGEIHKNASRDFFYPMSDASMINITGMVLDGYYEGTEMVKLIFRTRSGDDFRLDSKELIIRDASNQDISATFETVARKPLPTAFALGQNYPNPFNPSTTIEFSLPIASDYSLSIYNITGQIVRTIESHAPAGVVAIDWDANDHSTGIYFYRLVAGDFSETKKMVLLK